MADKRCFVILGTGDFVRESIEKILAGIHGADRNNIDTLNTDKLSWPQMADLVQTYSLFGTPRTFIIRDTDLFLPEEKIEKVMNHALEHHEANDRDNAFKAIVKALTMLDLTEQEYGDIISNTSLAKRYLVDFTDNTDFVDELLKRFPLPEKLPQKSGQLDYEKFLQTIPVGHFLIVTASGWDKRTKTFKVFQKQAAVSEQPPAPKSPWDIKRQREAQVSEFIRNHSKNIETENLMFLRERAAETTQLKTALEKLYFITYEKQEIARTDIKNAFDDETLPDIQSLSDMMKQNDRKALFQMVSDRRNIKSDYIKLCGYMRSMMRNAIAIKELSEQTYNDFPSFENKFLKKYLDILPTLRVQHPYYLFQCYLTFRDVSIRIMIRCYVKLLDIDRSLKSSMNNPADMFVDFFGELLNSGNRSGPRESV